MIKSYFEQMNRREQLMVSLTAIAIVFYLIYLFIYQPITIRQSEVREQLKEKKVVLAWMEQVKHHAGKSSKESIRDNNQLLSLLTLQLSQSALKSFPYQLQQNSSGNIQISYDKVPFNPFIQWLQSFQSKFTINIEQMRATKLEQEGLVKLMIVVKP